MQSKIFCLFIVDIVDIIYFTYDKGFFFSLIVSKKGVEVKSDIL